MIEAVNSVLANSSSVRGNTDAVDATKSSIAPSSTDSVGTVPQAPYISPYISVDVNSNKAVLQIRDSDTGDVVRQFPSESRLQAQRQAQIAQQNENLRSSSTSTESSDQGDTAGETTTTTSSSSSGGGGSDAGTSSAPQAQAQAASAALVAGSQTGQETASAGVSVLA